MTQRRMTSEEIGIGILELIADQEMISVPMEAVDEEYVMEHGLKLHWVANCAEQIGEHAKRLVQGGTVEKAPDKGADDTTGREI